MSTLLFTLAFPNPFLPPGSGVVWLRYDAVDPEDGSSIHLELPADWLVDVPTDVTTTVGDWTVDLKDEVAKLKERRPGARARWRGQDEDGDAVDLRLMCKREREGAGASTLSISGQGSAEFELSVPLREGGALSLAVGRFAGQADLGGLADLWSEGGFVRALAGAPPMVVAEVTGEDGSLVVETR